jgi:putative acetyltransferase
MTPSKPPDDLTIRALVPGDAEAMAELFNLPRVRWGTLRLPFATPEQIGQFLQPRAGDLSLVACTGGRAVGQGGFHRFAGRRAHAASIGLAVHDAFQGQGVGGALLAALIEAAERWHGIRRLELSVYTDNLPAIALYRRFGFVHEGTMRAMALRDGVLVDSHAMARLADAEANVGGDRA